MATELRVRLGRGCLLPASAYDAEEMERLVKGGEYRITVTRPRSLPHHRLYWSLLSALIEQTALGDRYPSKEHLHRALLMDLGYTTPVQAIRGGMVAFVPDSTAFSAMGQDEFRSYFDKAVALLAEVTGADPLELRRATA